MYDYQPAPVQIVSRVAALEALSERHNVPLAAAALQFPLAHPCVGNPDEVRGAKEWLTWPIRSACWTELRTQGSIRSDAPLPVTA